MKRKNNFYYLKTENGYEIYDGATNILFCSEKTIEKANKTVSSLNKLRKNFILKNRLWKQ